MRMKNIPNSNVFGSFLILSLKDAIIPNVVIVKMITNSFSPPVINSDNPAPIAKKPIEMSSPTIMPGKYFFDNIPL